MGTDSSSAAPRFPPDAARRHGDALRELALDARSRMLVGGELREATGGGTLASVDPTTGRELARIPDSTREDVDAAVEAARRAFDRTDWSRNVSLRKRTLLDLSRLARRDLERFATLDALEVGMVRAVALRFGARALMRNLEYFSGWPERIYGEVVPVPSGRVFDFTRREPFGVVGAIIAWNTPSLFIGSKVGPALAAGNTIVLKPSEQGSLSALHFAALCLEAGVPEGVINVVTGGPGVGEHLARHPGVDKVTFTGGTQTGCRVQALAAETAKPVHLELGGKSPHLVLDDADLDRALGGVIAGGFALSGQACAAGTRVLLQRGIHDGFLERIAASAGGLRVGDPLAPGTFLGPLITERQCARVTEFVDSGRAEGARLVTGGERIESEGFFVAPTVFSGVTSKMRIAREEIFGPVLSVFRFDDLEEAIGIANDTSYGLGAGIWTREIGAALRFAEEVCAGNVWINSYAAIPHTAPFGGFRRSGHGRVGGREAVLEYTQVKNVSVDLS